MQTSKYVKIPIDPSKVKQKVIAGLTKRQLISFGIGGAVGIVPFFVVKYFFGLIPGIFALCVFAAPIIVLGLFEKNGISSDLYLKMFISFYKKPRKFLYKSRNIAQRIELLSEKEELLKMLKNGYREK